MIKLTSTEFRPSRSPFVNFIANRYTLNVKRFSPPLYPFIKLIISANLCSKQDKVNFSLYIRYPSSPILCLKASSSKRRSIAFAKPAASWRLQMKPFSPSTTISGTAPSFVETIGLDVAQSQLT